MVPLVSAADPSRRRFIAVIHTNDTVRRSVDGCLACILGGEAAACGTDLTMEQLLKKNRKLEPDLKGLKA
jgi:hypothetical protein